MSLWPDVEPSRRMNSLNQTVYFLRRVFEPTYREDTSSGLRSSRVRRHLARPSAGQVPKSGLCGLFSCDPLRPSPDT